MGRLRDSNAWLADAAPRFRRVVEADDQAGFNRFAEWFVDGLMASALARVEACESDFWEYLDQTEHRWRVRVTLWAARQGATDRMGEFFGLLVSQAFHRLRKGLHDAVDSRAWVTKEHILSCYRESVAAMN